MISDGRYQDNRDKYFRRRKIKLNLNYEVLLRRKTMNSLQTPINAVSLPFLPGNIFRDPLKTNYPRSQTLSYVSGYAIPKISLDPLSTSYLPTSENALVTLEPSLVYGQPRQEPEQFVPPVCRYDKKILKFYGYFKQSVFNSPDEIYRVRTVCIYYYLEDDTIMIMEPKVENSGLWQGKLLHRHKVPKNDQGENLHWKDLNIGITLDFFGRAIRLVDCDKWTAEFLKSEGIELNGVEAIPHDPVTEKRYADRPVTLEKTPSTTDKLYQFLKYDGKVLRFYCVWDDRNSIFGEIRPYILLYFLANNTIEIREIHVPNDGHDPFPAFLHRQKIPKERNKLKNDIPVSILEPREDDLEWYLPGDLKIGKTLNILGRDFLIYDCDKFTQEYYRAHFGITDFTPVEIDFPKKQITQKLVPPYSGWGSVEDSLQSCLKIQPKPPKKNMISQLLKQNIILRFEAVMDSVEEVDQDRKFIIMYYTTDSTLSIYEPPVANSGFLSGVFLSRRKVPKKSKDPNKPEYLEPRDIYKGATLEIFKRKFIITDEDLYVQKYREEYPDEFQDPARLISTLKEKPDNLMYETVESANKICCTPAADTHK